jgi:hypothetical protein
MYQLWQGPGKNSNYSTRQKFLITTLAQFIRIQEHTRHCKDSLTGSYPGLALPAQLAKGGTSSADVLGSDAGTPLRKSFNFPK